MNIAAIIGHVASEPELRHTEQGRALCTFRVAVTRPTDADAADFFEVVTWERQAEMCSEHLQIGRRISVQGRLRCRVHDLEEQGRRTSVELVAHQVELLGDPQCVAASVGEGVASVEVTR